MVVPVEASAAGAAMLDSAAGAAALAAGAAGAEAGACAKAGIAIAVAKRAAERTERVRFILFGSPWIWAALNGPQLDY